MRYEPGLTPPPGECGPAYWFLFAREKLLLTPDGEALNPPILAAPAPAGLPPLSPLYLGTFDRRPCYAAALDADQPPDGLVPLGLRQLFGRVDDELFRLAGRAAQIVHWDRTNRFCGRCGTPTENDPGQRAKKCPRCGLLDFPRISPAVIAAIVRGDEILLARARRFTSNLFSVLAGFVEPGETLEECLRREVREEVGLEIADIRYFGSQPWPFPDSLMIAFTASYAGGEIRPEEEEIVEAHWYRADNLPPIPEKISIARRLIDWFVESRGLK